MEYFVHPTCCAIANEVETVSARRKDVRLCFIELPEIGRGWSKKRVRSEEVPVAAVCWDQIHLLSGRLCGGPERQLSDAAWLHRRRQRVNCKPLGATTRRH